MAGNHAREQAHVVVQDVRQDRHRGEVDDPSTRLAKQQQEKEHSLLVHLQYRGGRVEVERDGGNDDHRLLKDVITPNQLPLIDELCLQRVEASLRLFRRNAERGPIHDITPEKCGFSPRPRCVEIIAPGAADGQW